MGREGLIRRGHVRKALEEMTEQVCGFPVKEHSSWQSEQVQRPWGLSTPEVQGHGKGQCVWAECVWRGVLEMGAER